MGYQIKRDFNPNSEYSVIFENFQIFGRQGPKSRGILIKSQEIHVGYHIKGDFHLYVVLRFGNFKNIQKIAKFQHDVRLKRILTKKPIVSIFIV